MTTGDEPSIDRRDLLRLLAGVAGALRLVGSGKRHLDPPHLWCEGPLTAQVIRQTFACRERGQRVECHAALPLHRGPAA